MSNQTDIKINKKNSKRIVIKDDDEIINENVNENIIDNNNENIIDNIEEENYMEINKSNSKRIIIKDDDELKPEYYEVDANFIEKYVFGRVGDDFVDKWLQVTNDASLEETINRLYFNSLFISIPELTLVFIDLNNDGCYYPVCIPCDGSRNLEFWMAIHYEVEYNNNKKDKIYNIDDLLCNIVASKFDLEHIEYLLRKN